MATYFRRLIYLAERDRWTVQRAAYERGLGEKGFSKALRLIIREWDAFQNPEFSKDGDRELDLPRILCET